MISTIINAAAILFVTVILSLILFLIFEDEQARIDFGVPILMLLFLAAASAYCLDA